jgi:hypothetical protein
VPLFSKGRKIVDKTMIYVLLLQENKFYVGYSERPVGA